MLHRALPAAFDLLRLHALEPRRYPFLLESVGGSGGLGRFDILFAFPGAALTLEASSEEDFLCALDARWSAEREGESGDEDLPFRGGWFLFLGYELARQIEPRLRLPAAPEFPVARAVRVPAAVIRDRLGGATHAVAEPGEETLLRQIADDVEALDRAPFRRDRPLVVPESLCEDPPEDYVAAVRAAQRHIVAGDIYQANISRQWRGRLAHSCEPWMLYERLREANPAPFAGLAVFDDCALVSSSPERLLRIRSGRAETRPIAGTRPRAAPPRADRGLRRALMASAKERAEHVMVIDLERNDLGRVCRAGSVRVDPFMTLESYAYVHHIVSNVAGELRPGTPPGEVLRALFPGGSITGCPKVRCMEIIRELEGRPRGAYTGSMGYLNRDGSCDLNILIRTLALAGGGFSLSAGSGIVADSIPERELEETRAKARGVLLALGAT